MKEVFHRQCDIGGRGSHLLDTQLEEMQRRNKLLQLAITRRPSKLTMGMRTKLIGDLVEAS